MAADSAETPHANDGTDRPEPADDLVTTAREIQAAAGPLRYTATTGRIVLRQEVITDGNFDGHKAKAEMFVVSYAPIRRPGP